MCAFHFFSSFLKQQLRVFCASYVHLICDNSSSSAYTIHEHAYTGRLLMAAQSKTSTSFRFQAFTWSDTKLSSYLQRCDDLLRHVDQIAQIWRQRTRSQNEIESQLTFCYLFFSTISSRRQLCMPLRILCNMSTFCLCIFFSTITCSRRVSVGGGGKNRYVTEIMKNSNDTVDNYSTCSSDMVVRKSVELKVIFME